MVEDGRRQGSVAIGNADTEPTQRPGVVGRGIVLDQVGNTIVIDIDGVDGLRHTAGGGVDVIAGGPWALLRSWCKTGRHTWPWTPRAKDGYEEVTPIRWYAPFKHWPG